MTESPTAMDRTLWPSLLLLVAVAVVFQFTNADIAVQDNLFNFDTKAWVVDREIRWQQIVFHKGMRILASCFAGWVLLRHVIGKWWPRVAPAGGAQPFRGAVVLLAMGLTVGVTGLGKKATHAFCPSQITRYGGEEAYTPTWTRYTPETRPVKYGQCWPAGHASGGFGIMAAATLASTARGRRRGILAGLLVGWIMGGYQMAKGAHYLSDTLVTMLLAWIFHLLMRRVWLLRGA
jgi:membrane-associated PAP2 superfamily phosphatase